MSLKRAQPGLRFALSEFAVTPDEIDRYEVYTIINPNKSEIFLGTTAVTGTSTAKPIVFTNILLDYPRNLECVHLGTHAAMNGTFVINGYDQFGNAITENFAISSASNGGTTAGTKVFSSVRTGTFTPGTAVGNGTTKIGVGTAGTTTLFGLPFKIGGTTDVKILNFTAGTGAVAIAGGTIAAYVNKGMHAIKSPFDLAGTCSIQVWAKPTYNAEAAVAANMSQQV
jgi:hypothetical protein